MKSIRIGIFTDIHNGQGEPYLDRHMTKAPEKLRTVVDHFNEMDLDFVVNLGDTIDSGFLNIKPVQDILKQLKVPLYQVIGNHDYDVDDKQKLAILSELNIEKPYYEIIKGDHQFLFLDGNEISIYAHPSSSEDYNHSKLELMRLREKENINANEWNGGISQIQLSWLDQRLKEGKNMGYKSILFCHFPILPANKHNLLNDKEVLKLLAQHSNAKAWICGHNHEGNYGKINDCHVVTLKALVDTPDKNAYSVLEINDSMIRITGYGREIDRQLDI